MCVCMCVCLCKCACVCGYMYIYMHTHTHTHIHTYTHTHIYQPIDAQFVCRLADFYRRSNAMICTHIKAHRDTHRHTAHTIRPTQRRDTEMGCSARTLRSPPPHPRPSPPLHHVCAHSERSELRFPQLCRLPAFSCDSWPNGHERRAQLPEKLQFHTTQAITTPSRTTGGKK